MDDTDEYTRIMRQQSTDNHTPQDLLRHLTILSRRSIDYSVLSLGTMVGRGLSAVVTWCILGFLLFNLLLFLNIALGFALANWSESSPAIGFLYLACGYAVLSLLFLCIRALVARSIRAYVARRTLRATLQLNHKIAGIPYVNRVPYQTFAKEPDRERPYTTLQYAHNETMLDIDRAAGVVLRDTIYIKNHYPEMLSQRLRQETLGYISDIPILGRALQYISPKHQSPYTRRHRYQSKHTSSTPSPTEGYQKYLPYLRMAWDFIRPTLTAIVLGKLQSGLLGLFLKKSPKRRR